MEVIIAMGTRTAVGPVSMMAEGASSCRSSRNILIKSSIFLSSDHIRFRRYSSCSSLTISWPLVSSQEEVREDGVESSEAIMVVETGTEVGSVSMTVEAAGRCRNNRNVLVETSTASGATRTYPGL